MKIKLDFVSNSSSTSFVYISSQELSADAFLEAAGVDRESPVASLFLQMHSELSHSISRGEILTQRSQIEDFAKTTPLMPDVIARMNSTVDNGGEVITGTFSSENNLAEMLLCMEIFEMETDKFFLNAFDNYW